MIRPIYLDYNGTTPLDPEVIEAMRPYLESEFGNPSSSHWYGIGPKRAVEKARAQVAQLLGCSPESIVFTSGGTESNNHAIKGMARSLKRKGKHIVTSAIEHPAVLEVCRYLADEGFETTILEVDGTGRIDPAQVEQAIRPDTILITIMHANNEVGTIQPIEAIAAIARSRGIAVHTDAAQSIGKIPVRVDDLGVDLLSVAGHKLYAPKGVGALFIRPGVMPEKFCHGAGQERGWRAGTENVLEIVGLGKACELLARDLQANRKHLQRMADRLLNGILAKIADVQANGDRRHCLPNTVSLSFYGIEANRLLEEIGLEVAASAGAACHSDSVKLSHVLEAMRIPMAWAKGTIRFSVGRMTTEEQIDRVVDVVDGAVKRLRSGLRV
ncbi:cysteine desulfurase family protein [Desulfatirhabdium butyrativorans]|uniref:cysteine desulfurase family protein n=1 Tax=Desulfatirhabdium butyrativorans TaxID=340467 RepID=UPI0004076746|nr:cysteine desulfurase family protein [Desulfatirhabdium butyrativorans]